MKKLFDVVLLCRLTELSLKGYANSKKLWKDIDDIGQVFTCNRTPISGETEASKSVKDSKRYCTVYSLV